jgi:hypothetical protein
MLEVGDARLDAAAPAQQPSEPALLLQCRAGLGERSGATVRRPLVRERGQRLAWASRMRSTRVESSRRVSMGSRRSSLMRAASRAKATQKSEAWWVVELSIGIIDILE